MKRPRRLLVADLALAACVACVGGGGTEVLVKGFRFQPRDVTVPVDGTVKWMQEDDTLHTVTSGTPGDHSGMFDQRDLGQGETFSFRFDKAGTFSYFCANHPEGMRGMVRVE